MKTTGWRFKLKMWALKKLANGDPIVLNLHLKRGLYVDLEKSRNGIYYNVNVVGDGNPDSYGFKAG